MEELRDLQQIYSTATSNFAKYEGSDFVLPQVFKDQVKELNSSSITYYRYSAVIETRGGQNGGLKIYLPNQWFYVASYFTDLYLELQKYKSWALKVVSKDRLKVLNGQSLTEAELSILNRLTLDETSKQFLLRFMTDYNWWNGAKTIDRADFYVSPVLSCACLVNASQSFVADLCAFLSDRPDLVNAIISSESSVESKSHTISYINDAFPTQYSSYLAALRTKPFMLLAGISGTGKSRIAREIAKACWPMDSVQRTKQVPDNFCMIQVKPNWHDSTELLGYVSRIGEEPHYITGDFLPFIAKAWENPNVPFILCLDEMNLAPVEQYFAEYLSVIESRKAKDGIITTDPIIRKNKDDWFRVLTAELTTDDELRSQFLEEGITIPQNLFVIGTVNMDETTFSFSRKVLDRAMTIEMNEVNLQGGLDNSSTNSLGYIGNSIIGESAEGKDVYADNKALCDDVIAYLEEVNDKLEGTPFKIAYRTRNEFLMYAVNRKELVPESATWQTLDEMTSMKILSRIEGDSDRCKKPLEELQELVSKTIIAEDETRESISAAKITEMLTKLQKTGYTSYWT